MSRHSVNEPDLDQYEPKPIEDIDVPDFDTDWADVGTETVERRDPPVDPAEHAAHDIISALGTLDQEIARVLDLPKDQQLKRANQLRNLLKRAWADVTRVTDNAGDKVDQIVERLR